MREDVPLAFPQLMSDRLAAGMLDWVRQAGGTVEVTSAPGAGTKIRAEVPG